jgi:type I restriction enzyme S subunit
MRKGWVETSLGEVAEVLDRLRKPISGPEREKRLGEVPYYGATGRTGWIDEALFNEELVLLGEDAVDFLNPDVHKAYLIDGPSWVNNHAHVLRPNAEKVSGFFLMESLNAVDYSQFVAFGTRSKLTQGSMLGIKIPVPPLAEQKRIVDVVSSVDAYIGALQQQVDSARVARNAVLHELLSAGGDDWTETTLGEVARCAGGTAFPHSFQGGDAGIPFVKVSDMNEIGNERFLVSANNYVSRDAIKKLGARVWPKGTVVFAKVGAALLTEKRRVLSTETIFDNNVMGLVPSERIDSLFLYFFMETIKLGDFVQPGAVPSVNNGIVSGITISLPPYAEQKQVVEIVSSMDEVIQSTEQAVVDAKALRSGLLSDLLSGNHEIPASYDSLLGAA